MDQASAMAGREEELSTVASALEGAAMGAGSSFHISGEPGQGKTLLAGEIAKKASASGFRILRGSFEQDALEPFLAFKRALAGTDAARVLLGRSSVSVAAAFILGGDGSVIAEAAPSGSGDSGSALPATLAAVREFVKDSFGGDSSGLGKLEYGESAVLVENGEGMSLAVLIDGPEQAGIRDAMRASLRAIIDGADAGAVAAKLAGTRYHIQRGAEGRAAESERQRMSELLMGELETMAGEAPLLLLLEDMHWADMPSVQAHAYLSRSLRETRMLLLTTARMGVGQQFQESLTALTGDGSARTVELRGLGAAGLESLAASRFPMCRFEEGALEALANRSGGNPLFAIEVLKHAIGDRAGEVWLAPSDLTGGESLDELIGARLSRLEPEALAMAEYASCIGVEFSSSVPVESSPLAGPLPALDVLMSEGVLLSRPGGYSFSHALMRDILYASLSPRWRTAHHRRLADYYESQPEARREDSLFDLARHFHHAKVHEKAASYCLLAGEKAERTFAPEWAADFYEMALSSLLLLPDPARPRTEMEVREMLADASKTAGQFDRSVREFAKAKDLALDDIGRVRVMRKWSDCLRSIGDYNGSERMIDAAEALAPPGHLERAHLVNSRAWISLRRGNYDETIAMCLRMAEEFSSVPGAELEVAKAYDSVGNCHTRKGEFDKALEYLTKGLELKRRHGTQRDVGITLNNIGNVYGDRSQFKECMDYYLMALEIFERLKEPLSVATLTLNVGAYYYTVNDIASALTYYEKGLRVLERLGSQEGIASALSNLAIAYMDMGDLDRAEAAADRRLDIAIRQKETYAISFSEQVKGVIDFNRGRFEDALVHLKRAVELGTEIGNPSITAPTLLNLAETYYEMRELSLAEDAAARALAMGRESDLKDMIVDGLVISARMRVVDGRIDEALSMLTESSTLLPTVGIEASALEHAGVSAEVMAAQGEAMEAASAFRKAAARCTQLQLNVKSGRILYRGGAALIKSGHADEGKGLVREGLAVFEKFGMAGWAAKARGLLA